MTTANRLRALRERLEKQRKERLFESDKPSWLTHPRFITAERDFKKHIGDPYEVLGADWVAFFLPWHAMIPGYPDMEADLLAHQAADFEEFTEPSWSFGEMMVRQRLADNTPAVARH